MFSDTIVALSSGRLPSGVAVLRLSGSQVRFALETMAGPDVVSPRKAVLRTIRRRTGEVLDRGLVVFFPGPASFTGEDVAEFHLHGGRAVVAAALTDLCSLPSVRLAEAGEFTRRAFLNGKMDLLGAEALGDLVLAETEAQRRFAVGDNHRDQERLYEGWREELIRASAWVEAELDFSDEGDVGDDAASRAWTALRDLSARIRRHVAGYHRAEMLRDGFDVVILGAPNVGKSTLLNVLARRDAAIVSEEAGTTRDLIEVVLDLDGYKVRLTDTAGLREAEGRVEAIGIDKAMARAAEADLVLLLKDLSGPGDFPEGGWKGALRVGTKDDCAVRPAGGCDLVISARTGDGIAALLDEIGIRAATAIGSTADVLPFRLRQTQLLKSCADSVDEACMAVNRPLELRAEDLRRAAFALGQVTGRIGVEDLLDAVFSQFCIGK